MQYDLNVDSRNFNPKLFRFSKNVNPEPPNLFSEFLKTLPYSFIPSYLEKRELMKPVVESVMYTVYAPFFAKNICKANRTILNLIYSHIDHYSSSI